MRKFTIIAALAAVVTVTATGAHAASSKGGGNGKGKTTAAPSGPVIILNQDPTTLHLGSTVTFTTSTSGLGGNQYPQIGLECSQSGHVVYGELQGPNYAFTLGGGSSEWRDVGGGASCTATLYAYSLSGGTESITGLGATDFTVS